MFPEIWRVYFVHLVYLILYLIEKISIACIDKIGLWSAYIGRATTFRALASAIPLLLDAGALSCWMSPLARIAPT